MAQKALSLTKYFLFSACIFIVACVNTNEQSTKKSFEKIDISQIPNKTIFINDTSLKLENGIYYYENQAFSGYIKSTYISGNTQSIGSYFQGRQHGVSTTYFENGNVESERNYKDGIGYGRHYGFWENGNIKFDFMYFNDKRDGLQKQWYESGAPYYSLNYSDDKENGMQKAWRENGKPYINYEVKDGIRYGLQKSALCYTLKDEKLKK